MTEQFLQAGFYALLALFATALNLKHRGWIAGAALLAYSIISSTTFFLVEFEWKVVREIALATLMATLSFELWLVGISRFSNQIIMGLCLLDLGFCGVICVQADSSNLMQWLFAIVVNTIFIGMCAAVAAPGIRDGIRGWSIAISDMRAGRNEAAATDARNASE